ncbi:MAG: cobalamin-binding protein [candidate division WOR-3 bacterium]
MQRLYVFLLVLLSVACERKVTAKDMRVVSLSPAMTEVIFALGAGEYLVGVTTYCDYPDSAKKIYKVGDFSHPSLERIVGLKPDLVVVNLPEQKWLKIQLEKLGIKTFTTEPKTISDIYREIAELGKILKRERLADSLISYMKSVLKPQAKRKKRVYVELSPRPLITIGRESYLNEMMEWAGGVNIFEDLAKDYPVVNQEEVIKRNPEIILVFHPEKIADRLGWQEIEAVKKKKVYQELNPDHFLRPGPRLVLGFRQLEQIFE